MEKYKIAVENLYEEENKIWRVVFEKQPVSIDPEQHRAVEEAYRFLSEFQQGKVIYGINTGFGPMAQYRVDDADLAALQYNIIRSHSCGAGNCLPAECVRAAMYARLQTFLAGKSGVHPETVEKIASFLNHDIIPDVPEHGSVGASGDLVQLAHIALALIGEGNVFYQGRRRPAAEALEMCGLEPLRVHIREGLAITNGTAVMTGIGLVNLHYVRKLLEASLLASVMMNEIAGSYDDFMSEVLNAAKFHYGQIEIAARMREIAASSGLLRSRQQELYGADSKKADVFRHKVQPYYSLRCVPQIIGPVLETVDNASRVLLEEVRSVDDNPVVDPQSRNVYHGGNFHGDYVSLEMDKLKMAVVKLTVLAERQINYLFHDRINGILPPFVNLGKIGLNYGLQAAQFTATSTTAESQSLAVSMYVHSIPNNNDNQDVVSMGTNSALLARKVIENAFQVLSVQLMGLVQAVDCLGVPDKLSCSTRKLYEEVRAIVPRFEEDAPKYEEIRNIIEYLKKGK